MKTPLPATHFRLARFALGILSLAAPAQAQLITSSANLPPNGVYLDAGIHAIYGGAALEFLLTLPAHAPIAAQADRKPGGNGSVGSPVDEIETFGSTLTGMIDVVQNGLSGSGGPQPVSASGPFGSVQTLVHNKIGNVTGTFQTEMLALDLVGVSPGGPFMIRESPTLASLGQTTITDIGGGLYKIDSFFDVFTELSIDNGHTWMPSHDAAGAPLAGHMVLHPIPEASSLGFLAAGLVGVIGYLRSRR